MSEVSSVLKVAVKVFETMPRGGHTKTTVLSRLVNASIVSAQRVRSLKKATHPDNARHGEALPALYMPDNRDAQNIRPIDVLPTTCDGDATRGASFQTSATAAAATAAAAITASTTTPAAMGTGEGVRSGFGGGEGTPSLASSVILKNLFDLKTVRHDGDGDDTWHADIGEDVTSECAKHGEVVTVTVHPHTQGFVTVVMGDAFSATAVLHALHMRWFGGRLVTCEYCAC